MAVEQTRLADRMLRDAIVEVLRGSFDASGQGGTVSPVDAGLVGDVTVTGDRVRVDLALPPMWSPFAGPLAAGVQRRVQALPEVAVTEIVITLDQTSQHRK